VVIIISTKENKSIIQTNNIQDLRVCLTYNKIPLKYFDIALEMACNNDNQEIIDILLNDSRVTYNTGNNCIFRRACRLGKEELVSQLLANPIVDPSANNNEAFLIACEKNNDTIIKMLLEDNRVNPSVKNNIAFINACKKGKLNIVNMLIDHPRVNITDDNFSALLYACIYGHEDIVNILLPYNNIQDIHFNIKLVMWTHTKYCMNKSNKKIYNILELLLNIYLCNYINPYMYCQLYHVYNDSTLLFLKN
jgi:ankyrin repeat protein